MRHFVVSFVFIAIFVQANEQKLWFGRDYFGRRSLLWHLPTDSNDVLAVTSVTERNSSATDKLVFISFSFLFFSLTFFTLILFFSLKMLVWGGEKEYNPCMMQQILHEMTRTITKPRLTILGERLLRVKFWSLLLNMDGIECFFFMPLYYLWRRFSFG